MISKPSASFVVYVNCFEENGSVWRMDPNENQSHPLPLGPL